MITTSKSKFLLLAGSFLLVAIGLVFPLDAFASGTDLQMQAKQLGTQVAVVPRLIALGSYVIGTVFAVRALFALKGFIEAPDDNPITKVLGFGAVAALLIMLPYIINVMTNTIGADTAADTRSSSRMFTDDGTF